MGPDVAGADLDGPGGNVMDKATRLKFIDEIDQERRIELRDLAAVLEQDPMYRTSELLYKIYDRMAREERNRM